MRKITKRSAAIIAATVVAVSGGAAWAANWYTSGTNTGTAVGATVQTVDAKVTAAGKLWPGKQQAAALQVKNNNEYPVKITGITGTPTVTITGGNPQTDRAGACTPTSAGITLNPEAFGDGYSVPGTSSGTATFVDAGTLPNFIKMGATAPESCAGATFTISFATTGTIA